MLAVVGPTAAGKSALAIKIAQELGGEISNCDSVQVYRGFDIGTGKLSADEHQGIPHHLLDIVEPDEVFTAGDYRREALRVLGEVRNRRALPIIVGGTGLYLRALLLGLFEGPQRSPALRERLHALAGRWGRPALHRLLRRLDPKAAGRIHENDAPKMIRAIEVCLLAARSLSQLQESGRAGLEGFRVVKLGLCPERKQLALRINSRVERMFATGLLDETRALIARAEPSKSADLRPLGALGYRQACAALRGELGREDAVRETQTATRQYAKRQMTWFRAEKDITWFEGFGDDPAVERRVLDWLARVLPATAPEGRATHESASHFARGDQA